MKFISLGLMRAHRRARLDQPARAKLESLTKPVSAPHPIHTYTELRQQIHEDLRIQHPNGSSQMAKAPCVIPTSRALWN